MIFFDIISPLFSQLPMSLSLDQYSVSLLDKTRPILPPLSHRFESGTTSYLLGKNGSGKSTLLLSLAGSPLYHSSGSFCIDTREMIEQGAYERSNAGIMIALQSIPSIPGVKYGEFLRTIYTQKIQRRKYARTHVWKNQNHWSCLYLSTLIYGFIFLALWCAYG